ncbi:MAG: glycosyltransferase family 4 protein [Lachnospiraceae bacterium]|nr:glycosyltransferase family 4 protein [Lachnospiraceae bacterium]
MQMIVLIGKMYEENKNNGPGNVLLNLCSNLQKNGVNFSTIFKNEQTSTGIFLKRLWREVFCSSNRIINVHTDGFLIPLLVMIISKFNHKNTYYLTVHGIYAIEAGMSGKVKSRYVFLEKLLYRNFQNIICVSEKLKNDVAMYFHRTQNVDVIYNGVQTLDAVKTKSLKDEIDKKITFISVGGIKKRKGIEELLEAASRLKKENIPYYITIYGGCDSEEYLKWFKDELNKRGLYNKVSYEGNIGDKSLLYNKYVEADFQLCLSRYDTFNVAVLESMLVGCPVIVSEQCGAAELIESKEGFVVNLENCQEDILKIAKDFLQDRFNYKDMSLRAICKAKKNDWSEVTKRYVHYFSKD